TSFLPLKSLSEMVPPPSRGSSKAGAFAPSGSSVAMDTPSFRPFFGVNNGLIDTRESTVGSIVFVGTRRQRTGVRFVVRVLANACFGEDRVARARPAGVSLQGVILQDSGVGIGGRGDGDAKSGHGASATLS